jgi:hypothetical protein
MAATIDFRPASYFARTLQPDLIRTRVKGQARREMASRLIEGGASDLPHELTDESLSGAERAAVSRIHPLMMSGEYLPDLDDGEVEIARVILRSTTCDVMSVRARPAGEGIAYRIVDEYEAEDYGPEYEARTSEWPLTLGELLEYLETCREGGTLSGIAEDNLEGGASLEDLEGFVRAESAFYPDLAAVVDEQMEAWAEGHRVEEEAEEDDDEEVR